MTFQIGKFYKAGKNAENFNPGQKLLCVDLNDARDEYIFYSSGVLQSEKREACKSFEEWREPREWTIEGTNGSLVWYPCGPLLKPGETIKLREVL